MLAESISHNERQGGRNDLVPSNGESNNSIAPPTDTDPEQGHDVLTPSDISICSYLMDPESVLEGGYIKYPES